MALSAQLSATPRRGVLHRTARGDLAWDEQLEKPTNKVIICCQP
jgi:hypothetical protein